MRLFAYSLITAYIFLAPLCFVSDRHLPASHEGHTRHPSHHTFAEHMGMYHTFTDAYFQDTPTYIAIFYVLLVACVIGSFSFEVTLIRLLHRRARDQLHFPPSIMAWYSRRVHAPPRIVC